jgi:hypothetical protein
MKTILLTALLCLALAPLGVRGQDTQEKNVLVVMLIWIPLDGAVEGSVRSDYIKQKYDTAALCDAAKEGETQVFWNSKPGHRMVGTKECTDGSNPTSVSIGEMNVTVETSPPG